MTEKRKPTYDLEAIKSTFSSAKSLNATGSVIRSAAELGFGSAEIVEVIQSMDRRHFQKSRTSYADHRVWQDVYYVPSDVGELYVKFTADVVSKFLLLSFKEKTMADTVEDHPVCPETGTPMYRDTRPMTIVYKGETATFDMPGWYCDASDESIHDGSDMKVSDRALTELKAKVEGRLAPKTVRRIRKRLKLTQKDAGRLIGGGPNAFQKYESGDILVSHAVTSALLLLDRDPSGLEVLQQKDKATHVA